MHDPKDPNWLEAAPEDPEPDIRDPENAMIALAAFNGMCALVEALGERGLLSPSSLEQLEHYVLMPLDDPEIRDRMCVAAARATFLDAIGGAAGLARE